MASRGRQYPDGPHLAAQEIIAIQRAIDMARPAFQQAANTARSFGAAMDRLCADPGISAEDAAALGQMMHSLLGAPEQPGPPYVHTFVPPEPIGQDEDGNDIYPEPGPAYTVREIPLTELVDPDRPWWLVRAADACRPKPSPLARIAAEAVAAPVRIEVGEPLGPPDEFRWMPGEGVRFEIGAIRPPGPRIEITADFCQCPACREARCEP